LVNKAHGTFWLWARVANHHSVPSKDVFTGANDIREHPLKSAVKLAVSLDIVGGEILNGPEASSARAKRRIASRPTSAMKRGPRSGAERPNQGLWPARTRPLVPAVPPQPPSAAARACCS